MDNNFNIDENTMNKLNNMIKSGEASKIMSNFSPEMIENVSKMLGNNNNNNNSTNSNFTDKNNNNFDFNNIDVNTIMKIKKIMEKLNNQNNPRSNLLASLKPYLREEKKEKLDQYSNLMNLANIAELLKNDNSNLENK